MAGLMNRRNIALFTVSTEDSGKWATTTCVGVSECVSELCVHVCEVWVWRTKHISIC